MEDFQKRLKNETLELADKVNKLHDFMKTKKFYNLSRIEKDFLYEQETAMMLYLQTIGKRCEYYGIILFEEEK
jgi:hypothetical protein